MNLPETWTTILTLAFGLCFGSFLNVLIHRLPRDESPWRGRSHCPHCRRTVRWFENVPVVSFLALGGRCAGCRCRGTRSRETAADACNQLMCLCGVREHAQGHAIRSRALQRTKLTTGIRRCT